MNKIIIFKALLSNDKNAKRLFSYLTDSEIQKLQSSLSASFEIDPKVFYQDGIIDTIHYSWFIPLLNIYNKEEAALFILALNKTSQESLRKILELKPFSDSLYPSMRSFLRTLLKQSIIKKDQEVLPIEYLPTSELNQLLKIPKNMLVKVIDLLSMYDLKKEIKGIVETSKIKKIYSYLSKEEKNYLKTIIQYNEPFSTQKILIEKYSEDKNLLKSILHKRGLIRLSMALSLESIDLIWYVCHYLDIGRGTFIFKECKTKANKNYAKEIKMQILKILNFLTS
ncbi:MAG: hypothetical protein JXA94_05440 [Parachlamydiales bacterium]|nr:hypothetical protein [Parachlamydiales bacterium]